MKMLQKICFEELLIRLFCLACNAPLRVVDEKVNRLLAKKRRANF